MSLTTQDELKAELRRLLTERDVIEAEIAEKSARLNAPGQPGTTEPLVDKEVTLTSSPTFYPLALQTSHTQDIFAQIISQAI